MDTLDGLLALAREHGLVVTADGAVLNEAGLDYQVVLADDGDGQRWVLRVPRRPDVSDGMAAERRILGLVGPVLAAEGIQVPDWRIHTDRLVAYPALPGEPGLTLSAAGEPIWHMDPADPDYAVRLGRLLASLHAVPVDEADAAGLQVRSPAQVRSAWADDIARVRAAFEVSPTLSAAWDAWLADDTCWPTRTVLTHGEIYPAHVLRGPDGAITGVLDWTTARVDDPARDFSAQYGAAGQEGLERALQAYADAGGEVRDGLVAQVRHLWEASGLGYALFALTTGAEQDRLAAQALLDAG